MELEDKRQKMIKMIILGFVLLAIVTFIFSLVISKGKSEKKIGNYLEETATYTIPSSSIVSRLPKVLFETSDAAKVNDELEEQYQDIILQDHAQFTYQYSVNDQYFSLVAITYRMDEDLGYPYPSFETYNFDIKTGNLVTDQQLYQSFSKNIDAAAFSFEKSMKEYYQGELEKYYLEEKECDYNCFLEKRQIYDYYDDIHLFVDQNKLKFYRSFMVYSNLGEEDFYQKEDFLFEM